MSGQKKQSAEGRVKPSISIRLIRHAESQNNEIFRQARHLFGGGTPEFDHEGWTKYVDEHRKADPGLSARGVLQAKKLASYLSPHLENQASHPVRVVVSPMKRTLETILPTLVAMGKSGEDDGKCKVIVNAFYHESEGCHIRDKPEAGMNQREITSLLSPADIPQSNLSFTGFTDPSAGWYAHGIAPETRKESEHRAAKFYVWLCEFLDDQLREAEEAEDLFDAGVALPGEEHEDEHDKFSPRRRRRRTAVLVGHGDFMGLLLKRVVSGFGHFVESEGIPHRSAFVHFNTGITELEYFGAGRFLLMSSNHTPHIDDSALKTGGTLKDGWSYLMPEDEFILDEEVAIAFSDEVEDHVREQTEALKSLYLSSGRSDSMKSDSTKKRESNVGKGLSVEKAENLEVGSDKICTTNSGSNGSISEGGEMTFVVKRGLQVIGCASYNEETGKISDVIVRPSARGSQVGKALVDAVKDHAKKTGRSGSIVAKPQTDNNRAFFERMGFKPVAGGNDGNEEDGRDDEGMVSMEWKP